MGVLHILTVLLVQIVFVTVNAKQCIQDVNCHLPDCFCPTFQHPLGARNIPQIVYFGFDDAVTPEVAVYFTQLFTKERRNPNGCPITMSLYVCHQYTKYNLVADFFKDADEIAVHSVSHTYIDTASKLRREALLQKENIEAEARVPSGNIIGWRSPDLISAGDAQPRILKELNFTYDISLPYEFDDNIPFPYTLDYGYPFQCSIGPCPARNSPHPGFWEVPINELYDPVTGLPCTYVDACRPANEEDAYLFLMSNFLRTYNKERAPFGLNMHAAWFYFPEYLRATDRFIKTLVENYPDVYIISVEKMMAWMKTPMSTFESKFFRPWGCNGEADEETMRNVRKYRGRSRTSRRMASKRLQKSLLKYRQKAKFRTTKASKKTRENVSRFFKSVLPYN